MMDLVEYRRWHYRNLHIERIGRTAFPLTSEGAVQPFLGAERTQGGLVHREVKRPKLASEFPRTYRARKK